MADQISDHRIAVPARSGDTHVIGADGEAVNVDAAARAAATASAAKTDKKPIRPLPDSRAPAAE